MFRSSFMFFFFNDTATTEIYTLSLHDALPISGVVGMDVVGAVHGRAARGEIRGVAQIHDLTLGRHALRGQTGLGQDARSEEHTSELQSRQYLVCRLLLEKKKNNIHHILI